MFTKNLIAATLAAWLLMTDVVVSVRLNEKVTGSRRRRSDSSDNSDEPDCNQADRIPNVKDQLADEISDEETSGSSFLVNSFTRMLKTFMRKNDQPTSFEVVRPDAVVRGGSLNCRVSERIRIYSADFGKRGKVEVTLQAQRSSVMTIQVSVNVEDDLDWGDDELFLKFYGDDYEFESRSKKYRGVLEFDWKEDKYQKQYLKVKRVKEEKEPAKPEGEINKAEARGDDRKCRTPFEGLSVALFLEVRKNGQKCTMQEHYCKHEVSEKEQTDYFKDFEKCDKVLLAVHNFKDNCCEK